MAYVLDKIVIVEGYAAERGGFLKCVGVVGKRWAACYFSLGGFPRSSSAQIEASQRGLWLADLLLYKVYPAGAGMIRDYHCTCPLNSIDLVAGQLKAHAGGNS